MRCIINKLVSLIYPTKETSDQDDKSDGSSFLRSNLLLIPFLLLSPPLRHGHIQFPQSREMLLCGDSADFGVYSAYWFSLLLVTRFLVQGSLISSRRCSTCIIFFSFQTFFSLSLALPPSLGVTSQVPMMRLVSRTKEGGSGESLMSLQAGQNWILLLHRIEGYFSILILLSKSYRLLLT